MPKGPGERAPARPSQPAGRSTAATRPAGESVATARTDRRELTRLRAENARLFNETKEALERQTATGEILSAIAASPTNVQPVLDAIAINARRFCGAEDASVLLLRDMVVTVGAHDGPVPPSAHGWPADRTTVSGRAIIDRRLVQVPDLQNDDDFPLGSQHARELGERTVLAAPLLRKGEAIGAIIVRRLHVEPFTDRQAELVRAFADQAAIAIENVRLFNETKESLSQQTATSEVLNVISRSVFDLQKVFDTIVENAARLCGASRCGLWRLEDDGLRIAAAWNANQTPERVERDVAAFRKAVDLFGKAGAVAEAVRDGRPVQVDDVQVDPAYLGLPELLRGTARTVLAVPLLRDGRPVGALRLGREEVRRFTDREIRLVETFADQAVIAIENVRLFNETKESLEQQTATGEVLKVISRSAFDLQRVLDTVIESATKLTHASAGTIWRLDGESYRVVATSESVADEPMRDTFRRMAVRPQDQDTVLTRAALSRRPVQVEDVLSDPAYAAAVTRDLSSRTRLGVPLLREGVPIGVLVVGRKEVRPFNEKEIELAANFADQAVIAIENTRLLNEIQDKSQQLEAASRHKSEFLANMSHELRTPLNAIIGFSDVLEQRLFGELNDKQADYTRDIAISGRHLLDLVNEILDLSKVEAGRMELEPSEFALADTIHGALGFVRERAAGHRIALTVDVPAKIGTVVADERKIRQVLLNLLSNAVKFTPDEGTIGINARRGGGEVQVSVSDTGIGIAPEDQAKVFDEFQQVGKTSDRSREGTGLGLTLAKRFIELHGGRIWIESELRKGTTFTFAIPAVRAEPARLPGGSA